MIAAGCGLGGYSGLAHLTFNQKKTLCTVLNDTQCQELLTGKRAAIIIAGGGNDKSNTLWDTTAEISDNIYKMLSKRGFDNDEIYYLSPQSYADFNGDGFDDCIVDAPATPRCQLRSVENPIEERPLTVDDVYDGTENGQWLREMFINGGFTVGDITLTVEALTPSTTLSADQSLPLSAKVGLAQGTVKRVWAVLKPPKVNLVMDSNNTPILAFPRIALYRTEEENVWATTWRDAVYNGEHEITFYGEDNQGNIAESDPIIINVIGGAGSPEGASVQIELSKDRYQLGEPFQASLTEELGWGYDLYAAVVMPDDNFLALRNTNQAAGINQAKKWRGQRTQHSPVTLFDLTLPENLPTGEYCLYGILSPERENVLETLHLWVWTWRCFEVF
jgi:hypothetical protein